MFLSFFSSWDNALLTHTVTIAKAKKSYNQNTNNEETILLAYIISLPITDILVCVFKSSNKSPFQN